MKQYLQIVRKVLFEGVPKPDRTGTGIRSVFGVHAEFDLRKGFPLLTTKRVPFKKVVAELLWFIRGDTNIQFLHDHNVHIWDSWADENGNVGLLYGQQWRNFGATKEPRDKYRPDTEGKNEEILDWVVKEDGVDQLQNAIDQIKNDPYSRRIIVSAWNPLELQMMSRPCHVLFQFYVDPEGGWLDLHLYQRSSDLGVGWSFNVASYSLLLMMVAQICALQPRRFLHTIGDAHVYENHIHLLDGQLLREPRPLPVVALNPERTEIDGWEVGDFNLVGYDPHPKIVMPVAV
jgi:thymidylate synthase